MILVLRWQNTKIHPQKLIIMISQIDGWLISYFVKLVKITLKGEFSRHVKQNPSSIEIKVKIV